MCRPELARRPLIIEPLRGFHRPASNRIGAAFGTLQNDELAIPWRGIDCPAHESPALERAVGEKVGVHSALLDTVALPRGRRAGPRHCG